MSILTRENRKEKKTKIIHAHMNMWHWNLHTTRAVMNELLLKIIKLNQSIKKTTHESVM